MKEVIAKEKSCGFMGEFPVPFGHQLLVPAPMG